MGPQVVHTPKHVQSRNLRRFAHYIATSPNPYTNQNPNPNQYSKPYPNPYSNLNFCRNIARTPLEACALFNGSHQIFCKALFHSAPKYLNISAGFKPV